MKIKVIVLLMILFMPFFCYAEECKKTDIKIEKVELSEVSGNAEETSTASNDHNQIYLNTKMNVVGDSITYKAVIKNTSNSDYVFDKTQLTKDYINYDIRYEDDSNIIKAGEEKVIYLRLNYENKPQVENLSNGVYTSNSQVSLHFVNESGTFINPETKNNVFIVFLIIAIIIGIVITQRKSHKKTTTMIVILSLIILPKIVSAICTCTLDIHLNLEIDAREAIFLPGKEVNAKMKQLAGDDTSTVTYAHNFQDQLITSIQYSEVEPNSTNQEEKNIVSTPESGYPIYMWYDNGTIYWWSEDKSPSLNGDASYMFYNFSVLNSIIGLENFDTSSVKNINYYFWRDKITEANALRKWSTKKIENMSSVFGYNLELENIEGLENWDTSNVRDMTGLFHNTHKLLSVAAIKDWDVSEVENMSYMFSCAYSLEEIDLSNWHTKKLKNMSYMFSSLENTSDYSLISKLKRIYFSKYFDVSKVTAMNGLFYNDRYIEDYNFLRDWDVSNVTNMMSIFQRNKSLESFEYIKDWNVSKVENMYLLCAGCSKITTLDGLENWDVSSVTTMERMFYGNTNIIDSSAINNWNIINVTNFLHMFYQVTNRPQFTKVQGTWQTNGTFTPSS